MPLSRRQPARASLAAQLIIVLVITGQLGCGKDDPESQAFVGAGGGLPAVAIAGTTGTPRGGSAGASPNSSAGGTLAVGGATGIGGLGVGGTNDGKGGSAVGTSGTGAGGSSSAGGTRFSGGAAISQRANAGKHIVLVDMYGAFTANANYKTDWLFDGLHPNDAGYAEMAKVWYAAIGKVLH